MIVRRRLFLENVDDGIGDCAGLECVDERVGVDDAAPGRVDEQRRRLHRELRGAEEVVSRRIEDDVHRDDIRLPSRCSSVVSSTPCAAAAAGSANGSDASTRIPWRKGERGRPRPIAPSADDPDRLAGERRDPPRPLQAVPRATVVADLLVERREAPYRGERCRNDVLGRSVDVDAGRAHPRRRLARAPHRGRCISVPMPHLTTRRSDGAAAITAASTRASATRDLGVTDRGRRARRPGWRSARRAGRTHPAGPITGAPSPSAPPPRCPG